MDFRDRRIDYAVGSRREKHSNDFVCSGAAIQTEEGSFLGQSQYRIECTLRDYVPTSYIHPVDSSSAFP